MPISEEDTPKVFISHASEDKERFVKDFAKKLTEKGIDAWYDDWELQPGDSLREKIFEEGIKESEAFIVVLSKNSIDKPWVKEELDAGFIKKVESGSRLIPVIIDQNIDVPTSLKSTVWQKIENLSEYDEELQNIINAIYGIQEKPELGEPPTFTQFDSVQGLEKSDSIILKIIGDILLEKGHLDLIESKEIFDQLPQYELGEEKAEESVDVLESQGFFTKQRTNKGFFLKSITPRCFLKYCENFVDDCDDYKRDIVSLILNEDMEDYIAISSEVECPLIIVEALLKFFENMGYLELQKGMGHPEPTVRILEIKGLGRRKLESFLE